MTDLAVVVVTLLSVGVIAGAWQRLVQQQEALQAATRILVADKERTAAALRPRSEVADAVSVERT